MERRIENVQYCERLFQSLYDIGSTSQGGVTRLGYSETEDAMHEVFKGLGRELGASVITDEVGNTYVTNTDEDGYTLIGSHLDSVIEGGRYDGVAGVMAGLMVMRWAKEDGIRIPLRVGAFRCEESSNFGCCTIGSGLITHEVYKQDIGHLMSKDGEITGFKMRIEKSKNTTLKALQSIGFETIASGDSYNDLGMIEASKAGFLFRSTEQIKKDHPEITAFETYDELFEAIKKAMEE